MDGQQQFLKPAQHVPFYVKRPITLDTSSHPHIFGFDNGGTKPASYSVDFTHSRFSRPRHTDQLSEPVSKTQSKSLRDVFEKAILSGDVAIHSPEEDTGIIRNPSFITASLPRPEKLHKHQKKSATIAGDNYIHVDKNHHRSTDYFIDSDSESDTDNGRHNDAYLDDASSTISDELFKSTSDGPVDSQEEEFNIQPLPHLLDVDSHQAGRSTLGGLFKPKYRDYPHNNVHRTSERQHKEVIDCGTSRHSSKRGNSLHRHNGSSVRNDEALHRDIAPTLTSHHGKLPRTKLPDSSQSGKRSSHSREASHSPEISHNKYLPKKRRSSRSRSPLPRSPRLMSRQETEFNELEDIVPASPELPRRTSRPSLQFGDGRVGRDGAPLEQMNVDEAPWIKAEIRERRRRRRRRCCIGFSITAVVCLVIGVSVAVALVILNNPPSSTGVDDDGQRNTIAVGANSTTTTSSPTMSTTPNMATTTPASQNITLTFDGTMRVTSEEYTPDLNDLNSPRSQQLSNDFCNTMEGVFNADTQNTDYSYQDCYIKNFTNGSVIIDFELKLKQVANSSASADKVVETEIINKFEQSGNFTFDPDSISIVVASITTAVINPTTAATSTSFTTTAAATSTFTSTHPSTTAFLTSTGCAAKRMVHRGLYPSADDCTKYRICGEFKNGSVIIHELSCGGKKNMFMVNSQHNGSCVACNVTACPQCERTSSEEDLLNIQQEMTTFMFAEETPLRTRALRHFSRPANPSPATTPAISFTRTTSAPSPSTLQSVSPSTTDSISPSTTDSISPNNTDIISPSTPYRITTTAKDISSSRVSKIADSSATVFSTESATATLAFHISTTSHRPLRHPSSTSAATTTAEVTSSVTTAPSTVSVTTAPSTVSVTTAPSTVSVTTAPSTASVTAAPSTASVTTAPSTVSVTTAPSTVSVTTAPSTVSVTTAPSTVSVTTAPSTVSVTTAPSTVSVTTAPSSSSTTTTLTAPHHSTLPTNICQESDKESLVPDPRNCAKFFFCYSNSTYIPSTCPCNEMFDIDLQKCRLCDGLCESCTPC